jgi:hypothetical protein
MSKFSNFIKAIRYTKLGRKPRTPLAALKQARDFLVVEGEQHWVKGTEFAGQFTTKDPEAASCGNWGVCAIGVVALVTGDMKHDSRDDSYAIWLGPVEPSETYNQAVLFLDQAVQRDPATLNGSIVGLNDDSDTTRTDVIRYFDKAIALAETDARTRMGRRNVKVGA